MGGWWDAGESECVSEWGGWMKIWVSGLMAWRVSNWVVKAGWVCGMGGRLVGGVMAAEMEKTSSRLLRAQSAALSKTACRAPVHPQAPREPPCLSCSLPLNRASKVPDGHLPRQLSSSLCLCAEPSSLCRDLMLNSGFFPLLTCLRR